MLIFVPHFASQLMQMSSIDCLRLAEVIFLNFENYQLYNTDFIECTKLLLCRKGWSFFLQLLQQMLMSYLYNTDEVFPTV